MSQFYQKMANIHLHHYVDFSGVFGNKLESLLQVTKTFLILFSYIYIGSFRISVFEPNYIGYYNQGYLLTYPQFPRFSKYSYGVLHDN